MQAVLGQVVTMMEPAEKHEDGAAPTSADVAMDRYADGDDAAFDAVYEALAPRLYSYASPRTWSSSAAEDVVQQTFLQILRARASFVRGAPVLSWAYAIARRLIIDTYRRSGREELPGHESMHDHARPGALAADEALILKQDEQEAWRLLERLPPKLRETFELVKLDGLSVVQAAEVLGITPGLVKVRIHRARKALERELDRDD